MNTLTDDRKKALELYLSDPSMSLERVAVQLDLNYDTVRKWSAEEGWSAKRKLEHLKREFSTDIVDQAEAIRLVLFTRIVDTAGQGSSDDITELVKAWNSTLAIKRVEVTKTVDRDSIDFDADVNDEESD